MCSELTRFNRWADKQRQEAQCQLDLSNAGRTEAWKSKLWSRKLLQLKVRGCEVEREKRMRRFMLKPCQPN
jgi:hypothetical protein